MDLPASTKILEDPECGKRSLRSPRLSRRSGTAVHRANDGSAGTLRRGVPASCASSALWQPASIAYLSTHGQATTPSTTLPRVPPRSCRRGRARSRRRFAGLRPARLGAPALARGRRLAGHLGMGPASRPQPSRRDHLRAAPSAPGLGRSLLRGLLPGDRRSPGLGVGQLKILRLSSAGTQRPKASPRRDSPALPRSLRAARDPRHRRLGTRVELAPGLVHRPAPGPFRSRIWRRVPSPHFSYPFCCDLLRRAPASFRPIFPLDSMFSYSPAGNPVRASRGRVLAASRDERV